MADGFGDSISSEFIFILALLHRGLEWSVFLLAWRC